MLKEIEDKYKKQYELYCSIYDNLKRFDEGKTVDIIEYNKELQNVDFIIDKIKTLNERAEQLKQIYIIKHHIDDFTGDKIRKFENEEKYKEFKIVVDNLTEKIISIQKLQDSIIKKINNESDFIRQMMKEYEGSRKAKPIYDMSKNNKSLYIDKKN